MGCDTWVDDIILNMVNFDAILGLDWLSPYRAIFDYHANTVTFSSWVFPICYGSVWLAKHRGRLFCF